MADGDEFPANLIVYAIAYGSMNGRVPRDKQPDNLTLFIALQRRARDEEDLRIVVKTKVRDTVVPMIAERHEIPRGHSNGR